MTNKDIPESFEDKLSKALRNKAVLAERSKLLGKQVEDLRTREQMMHHIASELLDRQRELNYMLHRASSVLHTLQDTNLALSAEFTHIVKELPPAKDGDWEQTIERVNQLFKKTHELAGDMQDEIFRKTDDSKLSKKSSRKAAPFSPAPELLTPEIEVQPEPQTAVVTPEPELEPDVHAVMPKWAEPEFEVRSAPEPEPMIETVTPQSAVEPEPALEVAEPPLAVEPETKPEFEVAEPSLAIEPEPEPQVEVAEPVFAVLAQPEIRAESSDFEFDIAEKSEQVPQAFGEIAAVTVEEPAAEVEAEEPVAAPMGYDKAHDEQIERLFRQIQPIELKPLPIGRQAAQKDFFSKLFRRDKTPV